MGTRWRSSSQTFKLACRRVSKPTPISRWRTPAFSSRTASCKPDSPPFALSPHPLQPPPYPPHQPPALTLPCPPCSRLLRQQQEQGKSTMPRASSNPGLSSKDLTPWGRAPALTVVCAALLALSPKQQPPTNPSPSPSPSPPLPLKKRPTPQ